MSTYAQIGPSRIVTSAISLTEPKIIHFIPDFNTNFATYYEEFPFRLNNLQALVVKSNMIRIGSISLNPKRYFIDIKKTVSKTFNTIPELINKNKFIIIDHSSIMEAIYKISLISERRALFLLFNYLKNEFLFSKSIHQDIEHIVLISFKNTGFFETLYNNINAFKSKEDLFRFFDNYTLLNVEKTLIPFLYYKKTNIFVDTSVLNKIKKQVQSIVPIPPIEGSSIEPEIQIDNKLTDKLEKKSNSKVDKINIIDNNHISEDKISNNILNKSLANLKIKNENVENNIRIALSNTLHSNPDSTEEEINQTILKTINKTIYGTDKISQEHLDNPKLLLDRLDSFTEYYDQIVYNKTNNEFINPTNELISINKITGPVRHKYEFSTNIHNHVEKLFKTLETKTNPIDVLNITHTVKDNNLDRFIEYSITLKNNIGFPDPYTIKLKVPDLINDRYFKLNSKEYILSSQQFLKPLTKNSPTEARFISHFNMITEKLVNFKYSPSDISSIMGYISRTYSSLIHSYDEKNDRLEFKDGTLIDLHSNVPFSHDDLELVHEYGNYHLYKNNKKIETPINKTEFIFTHLLNAINSVNPNDLLKTSSRSVQYVETHVMGPHMPLILVLWQQIGLIESLVKLGIDFKITEEIPVKNSINDLIFQLKDNKYLAIYPKSKREEYIANGLLKLPFISNLISTELDNKKSSYEYLTSTYGNKILNNLDGMVENGIDPTTHELLLLEGFPTNIIDIISGPLLDKLFNDEPDHPSDLNTLRVRMSEYMTQLMYTEINVVSLYSNI